MAVFLKINLVAEETWSFGPFFKYRKKRDDDVDNNAVSKMKKIDATIEAGAFLGYKFESWISVSRWRLMLSMNMKVRLPQPEPVTPLRQTG